VWESLEGFLKAVDSLGFYKSKGSSRWSTLDSVSACIPMKSRDVEGVKLTPSVRGME